MPQVTIIIAHTRFLLYVFLVKTIFLFPCVYLHNSINLYSPAVSIAVTSNKLVMPSSIISISSSHLFFLRFFSKIICRLTDIYIIVPVVNTM